MRKKETAPAPTEADAAEKKAMKEVDLPITQTTEYLFILDFSNL